MNDESDTARVVREALLVLEQTCIAQSDYVQALAFERLAANGSDEHLARFVRLLK